MKRDYHKANVAFLFLTCMFNVVLAINAEDPIDSEKFLSSYDLHEENWRLMLEGEWMVKFYAPWCPACKNLAPTWERFASIAGDLNVNVAKIDVTTSPSLSGRFFVTALPTIYHVKDGEFRHYRGPNDASSLMVWLRKKEWLRVEPISKWKKPDSMHMSVLSYFFKLSHTLKDFNSRLQVEYGLPTWGSYALFAISTIFVGAALGLILVCIVDFLNPPKRLHRQTFVEARRRAHDAAVEDIANDELEDDGVQSEADCRENVQIQKNNNTTDTINGDEDEDEGENEDEDADEDEDEDDEDDNEEDDDVEEVAEDAINHENVSLDSGKLSNSDSDVALEDRKTKELPKTKNSDVSEPISDQSSPNETRKRKPRKAD